MHYLCLHVCLLQEQRNPGFKLNIKPWLHGYKDRSRVLVPNMIQIFLTVPVYMSRSMSRVIHQLNDYFQIVDVESNAISCRLASVGNLAKFHTCSLITFPKISVYNFNKQMHFLSPMSSRKYYYHRRPIRDPLETDMP